MTSDSELIEFIQARMNGKTVEQKCGSIWLDFESWNSNAVYRVKPEPKEWYLVVANTPTDGWAKAYTDKQSAAMEMFENSHIEKVRGVEDDE